MHPVRRRKKRPNYGIRTVEITRGKNGFGFTISGQQPCILSCIVNGSPAEKAGLRPGDYLVAVNGQSVSKLLHDDVVRLIGCLNGVLKLQIAENYYSDSSDEDNIASSRSKPKFIHKPRSANVNHRSNNLQPKTLKTVKDHCTSDGGILPSQSTVYNSWDLPGVPPPRVSVAQNLTRSKEELSFIIGYLGTIEMPKQIQPGCRPQIVRGCIKRLRTEKRSHSWVLMKVHADGVTVAGNGGKILAEYPVNRITFCGPSSEDDKKYFGLVTTAAGDGNEVLPSSSCHVFAVQPNLYEHQKHFAKANSFKVTCTTGALAQGCFEFPCTSEPILNAIKSFCLTKNEENGNIGQNEILLANSPQPSHSGSTAASSNSDSGIGFRDDGGNQSDRIVMVDVENQRLHIQQLYSSSKRLDNSLNSLNIQLQPSNENSEISENIRQVTSVDRNVLYHSRKATNSPYRSSSTDHRLTVRAISDSKVPTSNRSRSPLISSSSDEDNQLTKHSYLKNATLKTKPSRLNSSNIYEKEELSKSLSLSGLWYEKSIFYQLGLLPNQSVFGGRQKVLHDLNCKATSRSSDHLDNSNCSSTKNECDGMNSVCGKINSKSIDNLIQINSNNEFGIKNYKLSPQVNINKGTPGFIGSKLHSPLSISYGEGSIIQLNKNQKVNGNEEDMPLCCDKSYEVLLPCTIQNVSLSTKVPEKQDFKRNSCKSADDMSICSYKSNDALLMYKLSPKVFGVKRPLITQSLEDLKACDEMKNSSDEVFDTSKLQQWGSLQDMRTLGSKCYDGSLISKPGFNEKDNLEENKEKYGVVAWERSFEKLLEDPAGLNAFAEFLKKEFSQENITFWVSCEKYKALEDEVQRKKLACEIFETHLSMGATEPVNIDAHAHQYTQEKLAEAPVDLFVPAQKQIFNLMKFDSYPRFIKSDLYKDCLLRELSNEELPYRGNIELPPSLAQSINENSSNRGKLKKSRSDAEDCSRKSLLPWHKKNRSKSKDRGESEYKLSTLEQKTGNEDVFSVRSELTSSRSSLASWDLALRGSFSRQSITSGEASERENCQLCRVILSDGATTVVRVRPKETIRELIHRLLEKRGLHFSCFELYITGSTKPLNLDEEASTLSNKEVRVEQRIVFRLDLPNRRTVSVKAKLTKTLGQVLKSVLQKYSYKLDAVTICSMSDNEVIDLSLPVAAADGRRLTVLTRHSEAWNIESSTTQCLNVTSNKTFVKATPTLDEITNKVFEELLQGKLESLGKSDQGSVKSEEWGSEHSSGVFSKFLRRDSTFHDKSKSKSRGNTSRQILEGASKHVEGVVSMVTSKPPLIGKWKSVNKLTGKSESDELYEGLKRAQRNRLEDQRGTEINFELPDFLKDKENAPQSEKKIRKFKREDGAATLKFVESESSFDGQRESTQPLLKSTPRSEKLQNFWKQTESTAKIDVISTSAKKLDYAGRTMSKPLTCKTYETPKTTPIKNEIFTDISKTRCFPNGTDVSNERSGNFGKNEPPPLPPKPKFLPATKLNPRNGINMAASRSPQEITNRGTNCLKPSDIKRENKLGRSRRTVYLDQPTSSFV